MGSGSSAQNTLQNSQGGQALQAYGANANNPALGQALQSYGTGGMSLGSALAAGGTGASGQAFQNQLATDPLSGTRMATDAVQNNGVLGGLFGNSGQLSQAENLNNQLNSTGYNLTSQDQDALGQASGNIARASAAQDAGTAASLANRGFGQGASGVAGATFSGNAGNKFEQLAQAQTNIAQQRIQNTQNRIAQNENYISQLGQQGQNAINNQYQRQLSGAQQNEANNKNAFGVDQANQDQQNEQFSQQQQSKSPGLGSAIGGLAGTLAGSFAGGVGAGAGGAAGKAIGGIF